MDGSLLKPQLELFRSLGKMFIQEGTDLVKLCVEKLPAPMKMTVSGEIHKIVGNTPVWSIIKHFPLLSNAWPYNIFSWIIKTFFPFLKPITDPLLNIAFWETSVGQVLSFLILFPFKLHFAFVAISRAFYDLEYILMNNVACWTLLLAWFTGTAIHFYTKPKPSFEDMNWEYPHPKTLYDAFYLAAKYVGTQIGRVNIVMIFPFWTMPFLISLGTYWIFHNTKSYLFPEPEDNPGDAGDYPWRKPGMESDNEKDAEKDEGEKNVENEAGEKIQDDDFEEIKKTETETSKKDD